MTYLSSYQAGVYGDLFRFMPPPVQQGTTFRAATAYDLFPELFTGTGFSNKLQTGLGNNAAMFGVNPNASFNQNYMTMQAEKMYKPITFRGKDNNLIQGASMGDFLSGLQQGKMA